MEQSHHVKASESTLLVTNYIPATFKSHLAISYREQTTNTKQEIDEMLMRLAASGSTFNKIRIYG